MGALRRISPRLQNIPEEKRPYYGPDSKRTRSKEEEGTKPDHSRKTSRKKSRVKDKGDETAVVSDVNPNAGGETTIVDAKDDKKLSVVDTSPVDDGKTMILDAKDDMKLSVADTYPVDGQGINYFKRVKETLRLFNLHYLHFVKKDFKDSGYIFPLAVAIVLSGQYEDDVDNSEEIVYTGQGGHDLLGNKRQIKDQVMKSGNLALKNNMNQLLPIRVIRGNKCPNSITGRVYTYDGLYKVSHSNLSVVLPL